MFYLKKIFISFYYFFLKKESWLILTMENNFLQVMDYLHNLEQRVIQLENNQYLLSLDHKIINFINSTEQTLQYQNQQFNNLNKQVEMQQECLSNFIIQMEIFKYYLTSNMPLNLEQMFNDFIILQQVKNQEQLTTEQLITLLHQKLKGLPINNYFNINTNKTNINITVQANSDSLSDENIAINTINDSTENHKTTRKKSIKKDKQAKKIKINSEQESISSNEEEKKVINTDKAIVPVLETKSNQIISNDNENIVIINDTNKTINTDFSEINKNNINLATKISQNNETNQNTMNNNDNNSNSFIKEEENMDNDSDDYPEIINISQRSNEELERIIQADKLAKKQKLAKANNSQESNIQTNVNNNDDNNNLTNKNNNNSSLNQDDKLSALKAKRAKLIQHIEHIQKGTDTATNTELTNIESISSCNFNDSNQTNSNSQFSEQSSISVNDSFAIEISHNNLEKTNSIIELTNITTNKENSQVNINSPEKIESTKEVEAKTNTEIERTNKQQITKSKHTRTIVKDDDGSEWVSLN